MPIFDVLSLLKLLGSLWFSGPKVDMVGTSRRHFRELETSSPLTKAVVSPDGMPMVSGLYRIKLRACSLIHFTQSRCHLSYSHPQSCRGQRCLVDLGTKRGVTPSCRMFWVEQE
jgi:hypothetical protein